MARTSGNPPTPKKAELNKEHSLFSLTHTLQVTSHAGIALSSGVRRVESVPVDRRRVRGFEVAFCDLKYGPGQGRRCSRVAPPLRACPLTAPLRTFFHAGRLSARKQVRLTRTETDFDLKFMVPAAAVRAGSAWRRRRPCIHGTRIVFASAQIVRTCARNCFRRRVTFALFTREGIPRSRSMTRRAR